MLRTHTLKLSRSSTNRAIRKLSIDCGQTSSLINIPVTQLVGPLILNHLLYDLLPSSPQCACNCPRDSTQQVPFLNLPQLLDHQALHSKYITHHDILVMQVFLHTPGKIFTATLETGLSGSMLVARALMTIPNSPLPRVPSNLRSEWGKYQPLDVISFTSCTEYDNNKHFSAYIMRTRLGCREDFGSLGMSNNTGNRLSLSINEGSLSLLRYITAFLWIM